MGKPDPRRGGRPRKVQPEAPLYTRFTPRDQLPELLTVEEFASASEISK